MERLFGVLRRKWWAVCVILLPLAACSVPGGDGIVGTGFTVRGSSNKGPFIQGAEVVVHSLTPSGERTRETRKAEIDNEHGGFKFTANTTGAVLIVSNGAHLNEVNGMWSKNWVSLRAVQTVSPAHGIRTNVNILTHFGYKYILKQMAQGVDVDLARTLAQKRVLEMLNEIVAVQDADFGAGDNAATAERRVKGDAFLVVLSATLQRYAMERFSVNPRSSVDAQFNFLLNKIAALVSDDKPLPTDMLAGLKLASRRLRPDLIRENLIGRGLWPEEFSVHASNPLDLFIDTDADGLVNAVDTDIDGDGILNESDTRTYIADGAPLVRLKEWMRVLTHNDVPDVVAKSLRDKRLHAPLADCHVGEMWAATPLDNVYAHTQAKLRTRTATEMAGQTRALQTVLLACRRNADTVFG